MRKKKLKKTSNSQGHHQQLPQFKVKCFTVYRLKKSSIAENTDDITRCKPLISRKNRKARLELARKYRDKRKNILKKVLSPDETKINLYVSDTRAKLWRNKGSVYNFISEAWWRQYLRLGLHTCFWNRLIRIN